MIDVLKVLQMHFSPNADAAFASRMVQANGKPADAAAGATTLQQVIDADGMEVTDASVELDYSHVSASEVLRRLLPSGMEVPSSFEEVGHIAHLNLRDEALPYRRIIGAVLLEKHPRIRTIINKLGTIENEWRVFDMEVLAGDEDTVAEVKQHGARFKLDFRRVYWNSRLEAEHCRLVEHWFRAGQVVVDAMAGVGPFAVPAGRLGCHVYANDLNPDSYKWLVENIKLNKVGHRVSPFNMDGREFMRLAAGGKLEGEWGPPPAPKVKKSGEAPPAATEGNSLEGSNPAFDHIVMNLPATAVEFLDALPGAFDPALWAGRELPMVHVYAFLRGDETTEGDCFSKVYHVCFPYKTSQALIGLEMVSWRKFPRFLMCRPAKAHRKGTRWASGGGPDVLHGARCGAQQADVLRVIQSTAISGIRWDDSSRWGREQTTTRLVKKLL